MAERPDRPIWPVNLFSALIAVVVLTVAIGGGVLIHRQHSELLRYTRSSSQIQAQLLAEHGAAVFRRVELALRAVVPLFETSPFAEALPPAGQNLRRTMLGFPEVSNAVVLDADGTQHWVMRLDGQSALDTAALTQLHGTSMVDFNMGLLSGAGEHSALVMSVRLDSATGKYSGAVVVFLERNYFSQRYQEYGTIDVDLIALYDTTGGILARWPAVAAGSGTIEQVPLLRDAAPDALQAAGLHTVETRHAVASLFQLPDFPYRVVVAYDKAALISGWQQRSRGAYLSIVVLIIMISVAAVWIRSSTLHRLLVQQKLSQSLAREQESRVQRLEGMRVLAGGLAHDINNSMMVVVGNVDMIRGSGAMGHESSEAIDDIRSAALSAACLSERMLAVAASSLMSACDLAPAAFVRDLEARLRRIVRGGTCFTIEIREPLDTVKADLRLIETALVALMENAVEAAPEIDGQIVLTAAMSQWALLNHNGVFTRVDGSSIVLSDSLARGTYLELKISDNGGGMTADTLSRIFDPFFSTRFLGRGLGLSVVVGIARQHGGVLAVESRLGTGTSASLLLPRSVDS